MLASRLVFIGKLAATVLLPTAIALAVVMPLHFPISEFPYYELPTWAPIIAAAFSGTAAAVVSSRHFLGTETRSRAIKAAIWIGISCSAATWYLSMFILLNTKGS
ncbi:hypothetical protein [Dongia sedimenti]|uniref:Uncharacterized protein n=1 Tax=Dongia sedimenti TaxID=3064282 RepID=A0ABU0YIJ4_9PROT|nr:hypothetical protein [Rhodospirillaceae bacterium R-7]